MILNMGKISIKNQESDHLSGGEGKISMFNKYIRNFLEILFPYRAK